MKSPLVLKKGDKIAIVATARKIKLNDLKLAIDLLKNWGLEVILGNSIGLENSQLAGTDKQRASDFQEQLNDPKVKAIWCARGGYGTVRILDLLDFSNFKNQPKWIIGFSDVTVLHSFLNTINYPSVHAIMPITLETSTLEAIESLRKVIFREKLHYTIPFCSQNRTGKAIGELVGGNLSILYSLMGSNTQIDCDGKILFIEDLDEYLYHLDRMMVNLKRANFLKNLKGLIIGGMSKMKDNEIPWGKDALQIIEENVKEYSFPVVYNFPAGHIQDNRALILGNQILLNVSPLNTELIFL